MGSVLLHLSLLLPILLRSPEKPPVASQPSGSQEVTFVSLRGIGGPEDGPGVLSGGECPDSEYMGVGITNDWAGRIKAVSPGGPAWRAGIRPGHSLISLIEHPDGLTRVISDGGSGSMERTLRREPICYRVPTPRQMGPM